MSTLNFNASEITPQSFDALPAGRYLCVITESDIKPTKSGSGEMLKLTFEVIEGEYKNRKLWDRLNIVNSNADAERISRERLSAICHAVNVLTPKDTCELHDIPLCVTVRTKPNDDGELVNEIRGYAPREKYAAPVASNATNAAAATPPWKKN